VIGFAVLAALLTLAVMALLLRPLVRKDPDSRLGSASELSIAVLREQLGELDAQRHAGLLDSTVFAEEQAELERRALEDGSGSGQGMAVAGARRTTLAAVVGFGIPVLAIGLYLWLGSPGAIEARSSAMADEEHAASQEQIQGMIDKLVARLQASPDDGEGWRMLARSYSVLGRHATRPRPTPGNSAPSPNAGLLADHADALAMAQDGKLAGEPEKLVARALKLDPRHPKALALSGTVAFDKGDYRAAIKDWKTLLALVPPDTPAARSVADSIAEAERKLGEGSAARTSATKQGGTPASVSGTVTLAPELAGRLPADGILFVFAKNTDGSRMPLAMTRIEAAKFPVRFTLDDTMSMTPNARLSSATRVIVGARISLGGDAIAQARGYRRPFDAGGGERQWRRGAYRLRREIGLGLPAKACV
jgi:cytochrome c-type biogenesis protein CcmH